MMVLGSLRAMSTFRAAQCAIRSVVGQNKHLVVSHKANLLHNAATSSDGSFSTGQDLAILLDREFRYEEQNSSGENMPGYLAEIQQSLESDWRIEYREVDAVLQMYKNQPLCNGSKVVVEFHYQDTEVDEYNKAVAPAIRFVVSVQKATQCMLVQCSSNHAGLIIEGVQIRDLANGESALVASQSKTPYKGPLVSKLEADLKQSLLDFVQIECGVSTDVTAFFILYAHYKEHAHYVKWLRTVCAFVS